MSLEWLSPTERAEFLDYFETRFGIGGEVFQCYDFYRRGENINALAVGARSAADTLDATDGGVPFAKVTHSGLFKPATRGVQVFGHLATRNVVELDLEGLRSLVEGRRVDAPGLQGFVILKLHGAAIGVGLCREGRLESQLPRSMTEHLVLSPAANLR